jgi:uncharacterized protein (TIGR00255 family)
MIQSMTAFARTQHQYAWGNIICELRSINHRYLEMHLRLPEMFQVLETSLRDSIRQHIKRGKIECSLRYQSNEGEGINLNLNHGLIEKLYQVNEAIASELKNPAPINTMDILKWPGVLQAAEIDVDAIQKDVLAILKQTLLDLIAARTREGEQLKLLFLQRLESMKNELSKVRGRIPTILIAQREKLLARFTEASIQFDTGRLEQELVLFAQKIDVTEEIERLETHIQEVQRVLAQDDAVGRRLDFLMQELNREANTLGSKSVDADTTRVSVELKVLIEQMREQVQNVE